MGRSVDIWAGLFESQERFDSYLKEIYDDDDSTPLSEFAGDMGVFFYDHDFFEFSFYPVPTDDLRSLLQDHAYAEFYADEAQIVFETRKCPVNAVFLMWNEEGEFDQIEQPKSVSKAGVQLIYVGRFDSSA